MPITCMISVKTLPLVFCGREDGSVDVYDIIGTEVKQQLLFVQTRDFPIQHIHFENSSAILCSADVSGRVVARQLEKLHSGKTTEWTVSEPLLDQRSTTAIAQVLCSGEHSRVLISSEEYDTLWPIPQPEDGVFLAQWPGHQTRRWLPHSNRPDCLLLVDVRQVKVYSWLRLTCIQTVKMETDDPRSSVVSVIPLRHAQLPHYFATLGHNEGTQGGPPSRVVHIWDCQALAQDSQTIDPVQSLGTVSESTELVIAAFGSRLVLCSSKFWVSSVELNPPSQNHSSHEAYAEPPDLVQHFFLPSDWISAVHKPIIDLGKSGEVFITKQGELAVIERGLEVTRDSASFNPRRTSMQGQREGGLPHRPAMPSKGLCSAPS